MNKNWKTTSIIALLIALVIHVMAFLYFNISTLEQGPIIIEKDLLLELDFTEDEKENPEEEEEIIEENNQSLANLMKDIQAAKEGKYINNSQNLEQEILDKIAEENAQTVDELRKNGLKGFDPSKYSDDKKKNNTKQGEDDKSNLGGTVTNNNVTATCSVPGRKCSTKTPTYICKGGGKVHVDIKVDKLGRVKQATVNSSKSNTTNECIIQNALDYAKNTTIVNSDLDGKVTTDGQIIYTFVSQ